jgi:hypothetical protein
MTIWTKSSYSGTDENCVETAAFWTKSSYSGADDDHPSCIEMASLGPTVGVRDSKEPQFGHIAVAGASWAELLRELGR